MNDWGCAHFDVTYIIHRWNASDAECGCGGPQGPRTLSYNPAENAVLITSNVEGGSYELYVVPKDAAARSDTTVRTPWRSLNEAGGKRSDELVLAECEPEQVSVEH